MVQIAEGNWRWPWRDEFSDGYKIGLAEEVYYLQEGSKDSAFRGFQGYFLSDTKHIKLRPTWCNIMTVKKASLNI